MGLFDDLLPQQSERPAIPAVGRALLDTIAGSESPDYNTMYGGGRFEGYQDHPRKAVPITTGPNVGKTSSAAGRYQFLGSTWDEVKREAGLPDFSPESQDAGAWHLANKTYKAKTGRDLAGDLEKAQGNPQAIAGIGKYLSGVWTSLPGGIEPNRATGSFAQRFASAQPTDMSGQRRTGGLFDDLLPAATATSPQPTSPPAEASTAEPGGRFTDNPGQNFRVAREGVSEQATLPDGFVDRLVQLWENPPKDRLSLVGLIKSAYEGATLPGDVASGKVAITGDDGRTNPEVIDRSAKLASATPMGSAPGGVLARPVQASESLTANVARQPVAAPSAAQLKAAAREGFESPAVKELTIAPRAVSEFSQNLRASLNESGVDEVLAPKTFAVLTKLGNAPQDAVMTGANLQTLRRTFQAAAGTADKTERMAASKVIEAIDDFLPNVAARDILSGDPKAAAQAWATARGNYAAAMRSEDIAKALIKAQRQAESAGSGANIDNATRQQFKAILNNDKKLRGFNAEERAAMESAVRGTTWGNFARLIGKAAPTGIVSGALSGGAGFAAAGPVGGILLPIAGLIGKRVGDKSTASQVSTLDELVRSRAPLMKAFEDAAAKRQALEDQGQTAKTMSAMAIASRNLVSNLRDAGINVSAADVMRALTSRAATDDEETSLP
jgi:muramidase (phage lysozyme)